GLHPLLVCIGLKEQVLRGLQPDETPVVVVGRIEQVANDLLGAPLAGCRWSCGLLFRDLVQQGSGMHDRSARGGSGGVHASEDRYPSDRAGRWTLLRSKSNLHPTLSSWVGAVPTNTRAAPVH